MWVQVQPVSRSSCGAILATKCPSCRCLLQGHFRQLAWGCSKPLQRVRDSHSKRACSIFWGMLHRYTPEQAFSTSPLLALGAGQFLAVGLPCVLQGLSSLSGLYLLYQEQSPSQSKCL